MLWSLIDYESCLRVRVQGLGFSLGLFKVKDCSGFRVQVCLVFRVQGRLGFRGQGWCRVVQGFLGFRAQGCLGFKVQGCLGIGPQGCLGFRAHRKRTPQNRPKSGQAHELNRLPFQDAHSIEPGLALGFGRVIGH